MFNLIWLFICFICLSNKSLVLLAQAVSQDYRDRIISRRRSWLLGLFWLGEMGLGILWCKYFGCKMISRSGCVKTPTIPAKPCRMAHKRVSARSCSLTGKQTQRSELCMQNLQFSKTTSGIGSATVKFCTHS